MKWWFWTAALVLASVAGAVWLLPVLREAQRKKLLNQADFAYEQQKLDDAIRLCRRMLDSDPGDKEARLLAARAAMEAGEPGQAEQFLEPLLAEKNRTAVAILALGSGVLIEQADVGKAEELIRRVLALSPQQVYAQRQLSFLLSLEGRWWEVIPVCEGLVQEGTHELPNLLLLANPRAELAEPDLFRMHAASPNDPLLKLGMANHLALEHQTEQAEGLLREVLAERPQLVAAQVLLGGVLMDRDDRPAFLAWHAQLPSEAEEHPDTWVLRGLWSQRQDELRAAARCFWEGLRRYPNHKLATYQLATCLSALGDTETAARLKQRADGLHQLYSELGKVFSNSEVLQPKERAAEICLDLGRDWEAWAWRKIIWELDPTNQAARDAEEEYRQHLRDNPPMVRPEHNPGNWVDLAGWELPSLMDASRSPGGDEAVGGTRPASPPSSVRFEDVAAATDLVFVYDNGHVETQPGFFMHETTGGGVAVVDFDLDGWPDIYFTQGGPFVRTGESPVPTNRLFRNTGLGLFVDVTELAGVADTGFGQGVAVGDVDNDGWPDLLVANAGRNTLFHNNGDGTFSDVTEVVGLFSNDWTSSCLLADINGDGHPDVYEVNYLTGPEVHTRKCSMGGVIRACSPTMFDGLPDRFWLNDGQGRFRDVTEEAGLAVSPAGKGLGVVLADLFFRGSSDLYIANDMSPNFLFTRLTPRGDAPRFAEQAVPIGVAYDRDGRALAGMGIAIDDADQNGRLDLFVTNLYDETNSLYLQQPEGYFLDFSRQSGITDASLKLLGFGTQFLDGELDGWPDLVVTNGHIDDHRFRGAPFKMRPQYLRNVGGRFQEVPPSEAGPFFDKEFLGRGLARLDFNRDGLEDFVVSHMGQPVALLENRTAQHGHFLALQLRGTTVDRDAIGTTVWVHTSEGVRVKQLTAGDGYQASNQRQLVFGLGAASQVERVVVRWSHGREQEFGQLPADTHWLILENSQEPLELAVR